MEINMKCQFAENISMIANMTHNIDWCFAQVNFIIMSYSISKFVVWIM